MSGWLELGAGCALVSAMTSVTATDTGWRETVAYEVRSERGCTQARLHYDPDTAILALGGQRRLGDGTRGKLGEDRFAIPRIRVDGSSSVRVLLPELLRGDRAIIETEHAWDTAGSHRWQPARSAAAWSELEAGKGAVLSGFGKVSIDRRKGSAWVTDATASDEVHLQSARPPKTVTLGAVTEAGMSWRGALEHMEGLLLAPRVLDEEPVSGDAALARGIVDDRGWARTLVALTTGGPDTVELGFQMPARARPASTEDALAEVAVWRSPEGPVPLMHPQTPSWTSNVHTETTHQSMSWTQVIRRAPQPVLVLNREMTLSWDGDPAYELAPGRHSRVDVIDELSVPEDTAAILVIPLPRVAEDLTITGAGVRSWRAPTSLLVAVDRGEERLVTLTWGHPDAPTFGEVPVADGLTIDMQVRADGKVRREDGSWWLASAEGTPILPSRQALLYALEYRFGIASYPEPGLPAILRGRAGGGWEVLEDLRAGMAERTRPGPLVRPALWPRGLMRARRYGVLTESEAMLLATRWAQQLRFEASWVLVRPAPRGPGAAVAPAGYDHGLLRVVHDGELRWMDPSCTVCDPWEIRPDLEGASALGWDVSETPDPSPGELSIRTSGDEHQVVLQGSAALALRLALRDAMGTTRKAAIATKLIPGGTVTRVEGIGEAGADIALTVTGGQPRLWPEPDRHGLWMGWVGRRTLTSEGPDGSHETAGLRWERKTDAKGETVEVLEVRTRRVSQAERDAIEAARAAAPSSEVEPSDESTEEGPEPVEAAD